MANGLFIKVGELAERTGLTVRTLHYYEEIGLVVPSHRSAAGHRLYSAEDVGRLHRVALLRGLGLTLEQVAGALEIQGRAPLLELAERHLRRVDEQIAAAEQLRGKLVAVIEGLRRGEAAGVDQLIESIEVMTMIEKYYTKEQLADLKARADALGPEGMQAAQQGWQDLFKDVRAAIAGGEDPRGAAGQDLVRRWQALIDAFTGGDAGIRGSLATMYREEPGLGARVGGDPEVFAFMQRARGGA
jgi:DNA-binding transcriptional MerR regulator